MNASCEVNSYFEDYRDWFLLEEDKEKGILKLFVNSEEVLEKNVLSHFSLLQCKLKIMNFDGVIRSVGSTFSSSSLNFRRTITFLAISVTSEIIVSIVYNIRE